jgi:hypothetical protein
MRFNIFNVKIEQNNLLRTFRFISEYGNENEIEDFCDHLDSLGFYCITPLKRVLDHWNFEETIVFHYINGSTQFKFRKSRQNITLTSKSYITEVYDDFYN